MLKNIKFKKILAICLSCALLMSCAGLSMAFAEDSGESESSGDTAAVSTVKNDGEASKDETVYVFCGSDGSTDHITVSDWLKNANSGNTISDVSTLTGITNVKGDENYTGTGDSMQWAAAGNDIYYQGASDKEAPVSINITYTLDGKKITADELAGKSGKLTIRYDYANNETRTATINGEDTTVCVPFMTLTGMYLDDEVFSNASAVNGKIVGDGSKLLAVGFALPGLQDCLSLDSDNLEIPSYFEISADVKNFTLNESYTVAIPISLNELDLGDIGDTDELSENLTKLSDASGELETGANTLADKLSELLDGTDELANGLAALSSNSSTLNAGAKTVFNTLLATANTQIKAAGLDVPELTVSNYSKVLGGVLASLDSDSVSKLAYNTAYEKVSAAVRANESTVRAKVTEGVEAAVYEKVLAAAGKTMTYADYTQAVSAGLIDAATKSALDAAVTAQMSSDEVKAKIDSLTEQQIKALIDENMNSADVKSQIEAAVKQAAAGSGSLAELKTQLDSYNTFYQGLLRYTNGVDSAADGAKQINDGVKQLKDGAAELAAGMTEFNAEGVQKLVNAFGGDLSGLIDRLDAVKNAAGDYNNFSGIADDMTGTVKFIYKVAAIA